jgi:hypothetical protein
MNENKLLTQTSSIFSIYSPFSPVIVCLTLLQSLRNPIQAVAAFPVKKQEMSVASI